MQPRPPAGATQRAAVCGTRGWLKRPAASDRFVSHFCRTPRGPTLTMRIHSYSLIRDVVGSQQRPRTPQAMWLGPPLVVMNNFGSEEQMKLAAVTFQNLFPAINVQTTRLSACQVSSAHSVQVQGCCQPLRSLVALWVQVQPQRFTACPCSVCCCWTTARRMGESACATTQSPWRPRGSGAQVALLCAGACPAH